MGYIKRYPMLFAHHVVLGVFHEMFGLGTKGYSFRTHRAFTIFCVLTVCYFIVLSGAGGWTRYKLPAIPFYLGFVGLGIERFSARFTAH